MDLLITGTGSIGIAMAAMLRSTGAHVSLLARGATRDAILADGVHKTGLFGDLDFAADDFTVSDDYGVFPAASFDYILICAKTMANAAIAEGLAQHRDILKPTGKLVIIQNGWGNDREYRKYFDKEQVCSARIITGFQRRCGGWFWPGLRWRHRRRPPAARRRRHCGADRPSDGWRSRPACRCRSEWRGRSSW